MTDRLTRPLHTRREARFPEVSGSLRGPITRLARVACLFAALGVPAWADRVVNLGFDSPAEIASWNMSVSSGQTIDWNSTDVASSPASGSARFTNSGPFFSMFMTRCIPVNKPTAIRASTSVRFQAPVPGGPNHGLTMNYDLSRDENCGNTLLGRGSFIDAETVTAEAWHVRELSAMAAPDLPGDILSIRITLRSMRPSPGTTMVAFFDDVRLTIEGETGPASVSLLGPGAGNVGAIFRFDAAAIGCSPPNPVTGWVWSAAGATVHGYGDHASIDLSWAQPGTRSVSVSHPACGGASASKQVTIDPGEPRVQVWPGASVLYQPAGTTLGRTAYWINNYGEQPTTIGVEADGPFYTQSPSGAVTIAPGAWQEIEVRGKDVPAGTYRHRTFFSGPGLSQFLIDWGQLIQMVVTASAPADGEARPEQNRVDVTGESSSVTFRNTGTLPIDAQVVATQPWIVPASERVTIPPGGTAPVAFSIDRSLRPDADDPAGSVTGEIGVQYETTSTASSRSGHVPGQNGGSVTTSLATVIDTVPPPAAPGAIPPLGTGEVALFVPGVGHVTGSVGTFLSDLSMVNLTRRDTISTVRLYFNPLPGSAGTGSQSATVTTLKPNQPLALADLVGTVFKQSAQLGSLQIRASAIDSIGIAATVFNASNPAGTFGTTIPVVRSDRGAGPGASTWLTGLRSDATHHTNLYIQEMSGSAVTVRTDFRGISGNVVGSRTDTIQAFTLVQMGDVVPQGAVSAVLTNTGTTGSFFAYATPVDRASGDTWAVSDWARQYGYSRSEPAVIPVAGALRGANDTFFRTDVAIMNTGAAQASGTLRYHDRTGPVVDRTISLAPGETRSLDDVTTGLFGVQPPTVGHLTWTPSSGEVVITSRNFTTITGDVATFGSGVPTLARSSGLAPGAVIRFGGVEDSTLETVGQARPASFRTNFGIVETEGSAAKVRVTVRYPVASGLASARSTAWTELDVPANGFLLVSNLVRSVIGDERELILGDLRNVEVDFELAGGDGRVVVFTSSVDNGTGDSILRSE